MKRYKKSLVLGKLYPPHLGHISLINTALENSEKVHVMLCHNNTQNIPGDVRYNALCEFYQREKRITIHSCDDTGLPQHENECKDLDEFYSYWVPFVAKYVTGLDAIFTSENYGYDFARYLNVEHFHIDRNIIKTSGTDIRNDAFANWDFLIDPIKYYFVKRIVIMGPESVGKSTLTEKLAKHYNTNFVEEYGRTVYERNNNSLSIYDFPLISDGRQELENIAIKTANKLLFCDTEDITTYIFSKMFYPAKYDKIESWFLDKLNRNKNYDLYLLLSPNCESIQDGTRCFLEERYQHYDVIKNELINRNCNFVEIDGDWDERLQQSIKIINKIFNI